MAGALHSYTAADFINQGLPRRWSPRTDAVAHVFCADCCSPAGRPPPPKPWERNTSGAGASASAADGLPKPWERPPGAAPPRRSPPPTLPAAWCALATEHATFLPIHAGAPTQTITGTGEAGSTIQLFDNGVQCVPQPPQYLRARAVARPTLTVCAA